MDEEITSFIDEMLANLSLSRQSMGRQTQTISEIIEKSNSVLLHIESLRAVTTANSSNRAQNPDFKLHTCNKSTILTLTKIIERAAHLFNTDKVATPNLSENVLQFEQYLELQNTYSDYLCNCVRKLLAANDTISQVSNIKPNNSTNIDETTY